MKKVLVTALMSGILASAFLVGCGDSMEDSGEKSIAEYTHNIEEAKKKISWCKEKTGITDEMIEKETKERKALKKNGGVPLPFLSGEIKDKIDVAYLNKEKQTLDEINAINCEYAIISLSEVE